MLIFTPLTFGYLFAWLLYPLTVIVQHLLLDARATLLGCTIAAVLLLSLSLPLRIPAQTYGNALFAALLLFYWPNERARAKQSVSVARLAVFSLMQR